jgi:hypothetical protein
MNAASGDISFPSDKLQVLSITKTNSVMGLWIRDPSFTNSLPFGDIHFEGIVLNPGFTGNDGRLVSITFQAIAPGDAPIAFSSGAVLANDGNGTNILNVMQPADVVIAPNTGVAPSVTNGIAEPVSTSTPSNEQALSSLVIEKLPDQDPTDPQPIFALRATNASSGRISYKFKIGNGDWFDAATILVPGKTNEYQLPLQAPANAIDLAAVASDATGNVASATVQFSVEPIPAPTIEDFTRKIPAANQLFSIKGTAPTSTTVMVYLQKENSILTYIAQTDNAGRWSVAGADTMASGAWNVRAQAKDVRGALSELTPQYPVQVDSRFDDLFAQIVEWGLLVLAVVLLFGGIFFIILVIIHEIRKWRVSSDKNLIDIEERLRNDLQRIEKDLDIKKDDTESH